MDPLVSGLDDSKNAREVRAADEPSATFDAESVDRAAARLRTLFPATPLVRSDALSERYDADIFLKREDTTPVRSYKIRGAFHFIASLTAKERARGVVCASAGNHAQGVAYASRHFDIPARIVMPVTTPGQKVDRTRRLGPDSARIELTGDTFDEANKRAQSMARDEGLPFVPAFDDPCIVVGQATVASEILAQLPEHRRVDHLVLPVGGGGLAAGLTRLFLERSRDTRFHYIEPAGAPSLAASIESGRLESLDRIDNFVDGAAVARIGQVPFELLQSHVDSKNVRAVDEDRLCSTILEFLDQQGIVLEPAGALAIDALQDLADVIRGQTVVCIVSGGNLDFSRLAEIRERAARASGRRKYYLVQFPQRAGALKQFVELLNSDHDITRFEYLKKSSRTFGTVLIGIEAPCSEKLDGLAMHFAEAGFPCADVTDDPLVAGFVV